MSHLTRLHPRSVHHGRYPIAALCHCHSELTPFVCQSPGGEDTIDFANPEAVVALNTALIKHYYHVKHWAIPKDYLCPPIPGRADYIHYLADLIAESNQGQVPKGKQFRFMDIGTGAGCVYPIIANATYGWQFIATDIDTTALKMANFIVASHPKLKSTIKIVKQPRINRYFKSVLKPHVDVIATLCNPPFYSSQQEAEQANQDKARKLGLASTRNFGGQDHELWCQGGELTFISGMMQERQQYHENVCWFTSLVSNKDHIEALCDKAEAVGAAQFRVVMMAQGQKQSRFVAWSFKTELEQQRWFQAKFNR